MMIKENDEKRYLSAFSVKLLKKLNHYYNDVKKICIGIYIENE